MLQNGDFFMIFVMISSMNADLSMLVESIVMVCQLVNFICEFLSKLSNSRTKKFGLYNRLIIEYGGVRPLSYLVP